MVDGVYLLSDEVVQAVGGAREQQAVSDPLDRLDTAASRTDQLLLRPTLPFVSNSRLGNLINQVKGRLDSLITDRDSRAQGLVVGVSVELQQVQRICARDRNQVARAGPGDLFSWTVRFRTGGLVSFHQQSTHTSRIDLDPPNQLAGLPIPEEHKATSSRSEQGSSVHALDRDAGGTALDQAGPLLEVPEDADLVLGFLNGVGIGIASPGERGTASERLVSPSQRGVDDVFSISHSGNESSVRAVLETLRQHVGGAQLPRLDSQSLTVGDNIIGDGLQVGSQDLGVLGVNDLARGVHRHRRLFSTKLYYL